ncbi:MAG: hypothetical protein Q7T53_01700 [Deltaproteobacteria bacterium]|nr:hypothetical protein [Deltaproteobacteria bacterium]
MKKEKAKIETWCPLTGPGPYDNIIERARLLWSRPGIELRTPEGQVLASNCFTEKTIEKAQKIYDRWDKFQHDPLEVEMLEFKMSMVVNPLTAHREEYLKDITLLFAGLDASIQEVFSILAIYEVRVSKNPAWPLELLALAERYSEKNSPDALRGKKVINGAIKSGQARREQIKEDRKEIWEDLQNRAERIWGKNPRLSKTQTANSIYNALIKEDPAEVLSVSTIRQRIKKK